MDPLELSSIGSVEIMNPLNLSYFSENRLVMCIFRTMSVFIPGNAETIIDFECVPTYSQSLTAQIINMDDNVIIPQTSLKSGTIATCTFSKNE